MDSYNTYKFEGAGALTAFTALVHGTNAGQANLPGGANAKGFAGFTTDTLPAGSAGRSISLKRGRCIAIAGGVITHGDWVQIAGATGKVASCQAAVDAAPGVAADVQVIGKAEANAAADGDQIIVQTMEFVAKVAVS